MVNPEKAIHKNFSVYSRHLRLLNTIDQNNQSGALQRVLDSVIDGTEQATRKKILDNSINYASYGAILLFISYLLPLIPRFIAICTGIFLFAYGIIGGVTLALSSPK